MTEGVSSENDGRIVFASVLIVRKCIMYVYVFLYIFILFWGRIGCGLRAT